MNKAAIERFYSELCRIKYLCISILYPLKRVQVVRYLWRPGSTSLVDCRDFATRIAEPVHKGSRLVGMSKRHFPLRRTLKAMWFAVASYVPVTL